MTDIYVFDGTSVSRVRSPSARPLRWAAWRPDGVNALLAGNRGEIVRFDGERFAAVASKGAHNLRGVGWSPDGAYALFGGNRGAVLLFDEKHGNLEELTAPTSENLRRVAWAPDGSCALLVGNAGCVLRYDAAKRVLTQLPGDRAHTLRSIAWRPDGAYALIGAYASRHAGYPRPHVLYRCDGRYVQGILATDDEDDAVAIDFAPRDDARAVASVLVASYADDAVVSSKLFEYDGAGFAYRPIASEGALLGVGWHPDGSYALICGEGGTLLRWESPALQPIATGTRDNLVGPFWRPAVKAPIALLLKGPDEKVYTA